MSALILVERLPVLADRFLVKMQQAYVRDQCCYLQKLMEPHRYVDRK